MSPRSSRGLEINDEGHGQQNDRQDSLCNPFPVHSVGQPKQHHIEKRAGCENAVAVEGAPQDHGFPKVLKRGVVGPSPPLSQQQSSEQGADEARSQSSGKMIVSRAFSLQVAGSIGSTRPRRGGRSSRIAQGPH